MGPLAQERIRDGVESRVAEAVAQGAVVRVGGSRHGDEGWFFQPTLLDGVSNDMEVSRNELFGPVLAVLRFGDQDEAIALANDSPFGLAAGIWTSNLSRAHTVAARLDAGTVG